MGRWPGLDKITLALLLGLIAALSLKPAPAFAWWNHDWSARKEIIIDTTATGAAITDPIGTTPVLIRLDVGNFAFDAADPAGADLRFVAADGKTPLAYHIEKYDHLLGQAFIWVNVPDLAANAETSIYLYYGNSKASAGDDAKATYDASTMLVYHFGEHDAPARDWSGSGNTALSKITPDDFALIGPGARLDGQSSVTLPGTPGLAWAGGNAITWSIWFNETALQPDAILYSRTDGTNTVQIGVDNGVPFVSVNGQRSSGGATAAAGGWHHLAVVTGARMAVYLDGAADGALAAPLPALSGVAYLGGDATTGAAPAATTGAAPGAAPAAAPGANPAAGAATTPPAAAPAAPSATIGFIGSVDELQIANAARPLGFIKLAAIGQGSNPLAGKLLTFGQEEKPASWLSGPLVIILGAVTPDGWVIIGILLIMAVGSWIVMADKISYVNRINKSNDLFLAKYHGHNDDLMSLGASAAEIKTLDSSPLYGIYRIGAQEIGKRFANGKAERLLSAQSIAAIRSALDAGLVRQMQRLNRSMVLLTIAIAGGPFLGLLGTVVGVMITFASIAAAGDVNVNAIAPGISAALVATVAGLVVAIPALFGYNYLNSRISNAISDMQVFVDELETRMAEFYSPATVRMAAE